MRELTEQEKTVIEDMRSIMKRRLVLKEALTPRVRAAIRETLGMDDLIFAFDDSGNAFQACRRDTMRGVVETLEFEADHAEESQQILGKMLEEQNKTHTP